MEVVAKQLIQDKLILTALELHTELIEQGEELPFLRDYFSNPSNFEQLCNKSLSGESAQISTVLNKSSSQTTLDSLDWARFSEDGERLLDDRIAVLEFELRKARETIQGLRDNLTQATALNEESQTKNLNAEDRRKSSHELKGTSDLKPHEVCTLNFLINEYLVGRNYKMTANTFADENSSQDFENWDDVGLNIPRPPTLVHWLQEKFPGIVPTTCSSCQTDFEFQELKTKEEEIKSLQEQVCSLESLSERQEAELQKLRKKLNPPLLEETKDLDSEITSDKNSESRSIEDLSALNECLLVSSNCNDPKDTCKTDEYLNCNVDSIEDMVENVSSAQIDIPTPPSEELYADVPQEILEELPKPCEESIKDEPDISESSEILDPRNCDRLPPLGASSEFPQGILAGEFITAQRNEAVNLLRRSSTRETPTYLESPVLNVCFDEALGVHSRLQNQVVTLSLGQCDLLNLVCSSLHNIAPNVILTKREELLPLLVYCIIEHMDGKERESLLHLLFNLTKRPDKEQRSTILLGLVSLARVLGPERLETELLPQCWEQLSHKHPERRMLVVQSVSVLSPYTPAPLRNSLLLSMVLQLLSNELDKEVRETALGCLALLVLYLDDVDKISTINSYLISSLEHNLNDGDSNVYLLYSSLASWCLEANKLKEFIEPQFKRIQEIAKDIVVEMESSCKRNRIDQLERSLICMFKGLCLVCSYLVLDIHESLPMELRNEAIEGSYPVVSSSISLVIDEVALILGDKESASAIIRRVHLHWKTLLMDRSDSYISTNFIPNLLQSLVLIDASSKSILKEVMHLVSTFSSCIGVQATKDVLGAQLSQMLVYDSKVKDAVRESRTAHTKAPFVVSCSTTSLSSTMEILQEYLAKHIIFLALCGAPISVMQITFELLLEQDSYEDVILGALWACIVHEKSCVRIATASLWEVLVQYIRETELASRVVPALVTLATDPEVEVRASAIPPLSSVMLSASGKEVLDKVMLQLESVCEESQVLEHPTLQLAIAQCCKTLGHNVPASLLHNLFLPCLCRSVLDGRATPEEKLQLGTLFLDAIAALDSSSIPNYVVAHFILPPLNQLQKTLGAMSYEHMEMITVLTKEYTLRAQVAQQPSSYSLGSASAALGEDVKNKMSKIFASKSSVLTGKSSINTLFKKK